MIVFGSPGRRRTRFFFVPMIIAGFTLLMSCTDFFSNSWAKWAKRDPDRLIGKVTADNVDELIATAENNPDLSLAILKKIQDAANGASDKDQVKLQSAALGAAVNAVGLGQAVLGAAGKLTSISADNAEEDAKNMVVDAINSLKNLEAVNSALTSILPDPGADPLTPSAEFSAFAAGASADDLALTAAVLIAGEAKKQIDGYNGDVDAYVDDITDRVENGTLTYTENLAQAMAIASVLVDRQDELSGSLLDVLNGLNLLTVLPKITV